MWWGRTSVTVGQCVRGVWRARDCVSVGVSAISLISVRIFIPREWGMYDIITKGIIHIKTNLDVITCGQGSDRSFQHSQVSIQG